jgi:hypothetical protein
MNVERLAPAAGGQQPSLDSLGSWHALAQNAGNLLIRRTGVVIGPHLRWQAQKPENQPVLQAFRAQSARPRRMHDSVHFATSSRRVHIPTANLKTFRPLDASDASDRAVTPVLLALIPVSH